MGNTSGTIYMHGDSGWTVSLGNGSSITSYTEGMKINNNGSIIIPSGDVSILKNSVVSGNLTISGFTKFSNFNFGNICFCIGWKG